jgi:hypothetical protein
VADVENYRPRHAAADVPELRKTWRPNVKVVSGAVGGLATLGAYWLFGPDADPQVASAATLVVMTLVSYFVPLPE